MPNQSTDAWKFQVWGSCGLAVGMMLYGIYQLQVDWWTKGFLFMGLVFTIGSCFALAKTIRDEHENKKSVNRLKGAKQEEMLKEFDK